MPRARMIKPEFWSNEKAVDCSRDARLLLIGMWTQADDSGIVRDNPRELKMAVFPGDDDMPREKVAGLIEELCRAGLLERYTVDGATYLRAHDWSDHQAIKHPSYRHPLPDGSSPKSQFSRGKNNTNSRADTGGAHREPSRTPPTAHPEASPTPPGGVPTQEERRGEKRRETISSSPLTASSPSTDVDTSAYARGNEQPHAEIPVNPAHPVQDERKHPAAVYGQTCMRVKAAMKEHWPDHELQIDMMDAKLVQAWLADGIEPDDLVLMIDIVCGERVQLGREHGPPTTFKYFHRRVVERIDELRKRAGEEQQRASGDVIVYNGTEWPREMFDKWWQARLRYLKTGGSWLEAWRDIPVPRTRNAQPPAGVPVAIWAEMLEAHWKRIDIVEGRRSA
jgi:hypothetical protein